MDATTFDTEFLRIGASLPCECHALGCDRCGGSGTLDVLQYGCSCEGRTQDPCCGGTGTVYEQSLVYVEAGTAYPFYLQTASREGGVIKLRGFVSVGSSWTAHKRTRSTTFAQEYAEGRVSHG